MKTSIVLLSILVVVLAVSFWKHVHSAGVALETATSQTSTLSNKLAEATMKVTHQEQVAAAATANLSQHLQDVIALSNLLTKAQGELPSARTEIAGLKMQLLERSARISELETQSAALIRRLDPSAAEIESLHLQLDESHAQLAAMEAALASLADEIRGLKAEKAQMVVQLNDPAALRSRARQLERRGSSQPSRKEFAQRLELQPDGSVKLPAPPPRFSDPSSIQGK